MIVNTFKKKGNIINFFTKNHLSFIFIILFLLVILFSKNIYSCCLQDNICINTNDENICSDGFFFSGDCDEITSITMGNHIIDNPCEEGCCCATENVPNYQDYNKNEELLETTKFYCINKGDSFDFREKVSDSCAETCGSNIINDANYITISFKGVVTDKNNNPVSGASVFLESYDQSVLTDEDGRFSLELSVKNEDQGKNVNLIVEKDSCVSFKETTLNDNYGLDIKLVCDDFCNQEIPSLSVDINSFSTNKELPITVNFKNNCNVDKANIILFKKYENNDEVYKYYIGITPIDFSCSNDNTCAGSISLSLDPGDYCVEAELVYGDFSVLSEENCFELTNCEPGCELIDGSMKLVTCDGSKKIINDCEGACIMIDNLPKCINSFDCSKCNGPLNLFASLDIFKIASPITNLFTKCSDSAIAQFCFLNNPAFPTKAYSSCSNVNSCTDYTSESSCNNNPCGLDVNCEWSTINQELGLGVCSEKKNDYSIGNCEKCEDLFGDCNRELCSVMGDNCYFDSDSNDFNYAVLGENFKPKCRSKENMFCALYDNKEDCIGNNPYVLSNDNKRIRSNDYLGFGVCKWSDKENRCYGDPDDNGNNKEGHNIEEALFNNLLYTFSNEDSESNAFFKNKISLINDYEPPVTTIFSVGENNIIPLHELPLLRYSVKDNLFPATYLKTYFCLGENCYPDKTLSELAASINMEKGETKSFVLRYYSEDPNHNKEEVKKIIITLKNFGVPILKSVDFE